MAEKKKILIVEDEKPIANALKMKLEKIGFLVSVCHDGQEGIKKIKNDTYHLVLLDIIMPKMNGFEVLETLNKLKNKTPVIVSTNLGQKEDIDRAKKLGALDFFIKSNTALTTVVQKIEAVLKK